MPLRISAHKMNHPSSLKESPKPGIANPNDPPRITRSSEWIAHFENNAATQRPIPWELGASVSDEEWSAIAGSLRAWQLGETSDGSHLMEAARHYAVPRMETWVTPVVMVETHALICYNALRRATRSPVLRAICGQILADEVTPIRFQCERVAILHRSRPAWLGRLTIDFQKLM